MGSQVDGVDDHGHAVDDDALDEADRRTLAADETLADHQPRPRSEASAVPERIGRYAVLRRLGAGGMGVVYEAHDTVVDRRVAIKLLRDRGGETERLRLVREAQALAQLSHPHVVQVFEVGTEGERAFLAMELVEGTSLDRWLRAEPRDVRAILAVLVQAGEGLAAAHAAGLVHRDFKPGNVLVGTDGRVRVLDFGLARASPGARPPAASPPASASPEVWSRDLTHAGALLGTPAYMSPEQLGTEPVTAASDQFAFCVVLYEALYRQHPFGDHDDVHALLHDVLEGQLRPPPPSREVPPRLRAAVLRGLATDPRERWPAMEPLLQTLRAVLRPAAWKRWTGAAAVVLAAVSAGAWALAGASLPGPAASCTGADAKLADVWGPSQRAAIERAFLATERAYAAPTWERVAPLLDGYGEAWRSTHTEVCEAQGAEALDRRMACLERLRSALATQVQILEHADAAVLEQAVVAVQGLRPPSSCLDAEADEWAASSDPEQAARDATLDRAEALVRSGRYRDARALAEPLLASLAGREQAPLEGRLRLVLGEAYEQLGDYPRAEEQLERAYFLARGIDGPQLTRIAQQASRRLIVLLGSSTQETDRALEWARHAEAEHERGADPLDEADLLSSLGAMHRERGEYAEGLRLHEQSLALYRKSLPAADMRIATELSAIGILLRQLERNEEAMQHHAQAVEIAESVLGSTHPGLAALLGNFAAAQLGAGHEREAVATMERSLAIQEANVGADSVVLTQPLSNFSVMLSRVGRHDEAERVVSRAIAILEETGAKPATLCNAFVNLATARHQAGRLEAAVEAHRRAIATCEEAGRTEHVHFAGYLVQFAETLELLGELEPAEAVLRRAEALLVRLGQAEVTPDRFIVVLVPLMRVSLQRGRFADAVAYGERILALEPKASGVARRQAQTRLLLARAYWGTGEHEVALAHARDAARRAAQLGDSVVAQRIRREIQAWRTEHDPELDAAAP